MTKALFFDIDGTLVSFSTHCVPQSTIEALTEAKRHGVQIFISTGRAKLIIDNIKPLQELGLVDGYITMNGAYCFAGDTVISHNPINRQSLHTILDYTWQQQVACIVVCEHDAYTTYADDQQLHDIFYDQLSCPVRFKEVNVSQAMNVGEVYQLTPFLSIEQESELKTMVSEVEMGRWHPAFVDITACGCTKQKGIDDIIAHFGISLDETMAFGDGGNDMTMLRHAHIGVAMGNASAAVQAVADYVTDTVDCDGIAKALKHFGVI